MTDTDPRPPPTNGLRALIEGPDRDAIQAAVPAVLAIKEEQNRAFDLMRISHVVVQ